jgi:hypothetical protein
MTMREKLIELIQEFDNFFYELPITNPIMVPEPVPCEHAKEPLDFENAELVNIDLLSNKITICHGGDWQEPKMYTLHYNEEINAFTPIPQTIIHNTFRDGLTLNTIKRILRV